MNALLGAYLRFLHGIRHHVWLDIRLQSWLIFILLLAAILALLDVLPGGWPLAALVGLLILALLASQWWANRRFYVHFIPAEETTPATGAQPPLWPRDKLPLQATGHFAVEGRRQRLTGLVAYYRTFETREHAIMARCTPTKYLGGRLDSRYLSMWYIFIKPPALKRVQPGMLYFGNRPQRALRLDYVETDERDRVRAAHCYLVFDDEADRQRAYEDLMLDAGGPARRPWRPDRAG